MESLSIPLLPDGALLEFILASPMQALCMVFSYIGATGALAYFPHQAMSRAPIRQRWLAAMIAIIGVLWLVLAYRVATQVEPDRLFVYTQAFASLAPFGILTLVLERTFGHPWFQTKDDIGPRLLAQAKSRLCRQRIL